MLWEITQFKAWKIQDNRETAYDFIMLIKLRNEKEDGVGLQEKINQRTCMHRCIIHGNRQ